MKNSVRIISILLVLLMCSFIFVSCDSGDSYGSENIVPDISIDNDKLSDINGIIANGSVSKPNQGNSSLPSDSENNDNNESEYESKIIKKYWMETETKEFTNSISKLEELIQTSKGYIESASTTGQSIYNNETMRRTAKYVIRIPSASIDTFVKNTESMFNVVSSNSTSENVTVKYYDLQSRYEVLEAEKTALNDMLEKATTIDNMLKIRNQLNNVIAEMESIKTQLKVYDSLVSYSTVTLTINEVVEYTEIRDDEPRWGERLGTAFKESWKDFADNFQDFTVWFLYAFPTILVLGIIATGVGIAVHFMNKKTKKEWEERKKKQSENSNNTDQK